MKRAGVFLCCILTLLITCACDPYSGKRPFDYGRATWICEEYSIWFCVDMEQEDYYYPKGKIQLNGNIYFCKFYFIHQTNQVSISVYPLEYENISDAALDTNFMFGELHGECKFSEDSFVLFVDEARDTVFDGRVDQMIFVRQG